MDITNIILTIFIIVTIIIYFMLFSHIIKFLVLEPVFAFFVLVYLITVTSININAIKIIDGEKDSDKLISRNINITILSFAVITLIMAIFIHSGMTYILHFTPVGKFINQVNNQVNNLGV